MMSRAAIVRPIKSQCSEPNTRAVVALGAYTGWLEIVHRNCPHLDIARWRCLVQAWSEVGRNVPLIWIDADVEFLVPEAVQLVELAANGEFDAVAGVYPIRQTKTPAVKLAAPAERYDTNPKAPTLLDAEWIHFGFTVTMPSAWRKLEQLADKPPAAKSPKHGMVPMWWQSGVDDDGSPIGDDVIFCRRLKAAGGRIAVAPNLSVAHDGQRLSREEVLHWAVTEEFHGPRP